MLKCWHGLTGRIIKTGVHRGLYCHNMCKVTNCVLVVFMLKFNNIRGLSDRTKCSHNKKGILVCHTENIKIPRSENISNSQSSFKVFHRIQFRVINNKTKVWNGGATYFLNLAWTDRLLPKSNVWRIAYCNCSNKKL